MQGVRRYYRTAYFLAQQKSLTPSLQRLWGRINFERVSSNIFFYSPVLRSRRVFGLKTRVISTFCDLTRVPWPCFGRILPALLVFS